jgi:hypothetical protein
MGNRWRVMMLASGLAEMMDIRTATRIWSMGVHAQIR